MLLTDDEGRFDPIDNNVTISFINAGTSPIAAGHSHSQQKTMNASTATQPVTIDTNGSTQAMNNPISINSVTDASVAFSNMEVGAPQPAQRKVVETKTHSIANQLNFRHGSDYIVADKEQFSLNSNSSLNDRKQHNLVSLTTTQCVVPNNKCVNINRLNNKYLQQSKSADEGSNSNDIVFVSNASESEIIKNRESENWFPSKRNSLNLLAEQHQKLERELGRPKMVSAAFDESEDLQYGPGIVSKLRCRYLSLALRQTIKQRPTLDNLRRTNSLSNLLDEEDEEHCDGDGIDEQKSQNGGTGIYERISAQINDHNKSILANSHDNSIDNIEYNSTKSIIMPINADDQLKEKKQHFKNANESNGNDSRRQVQRGNDSLKRARSVEALMRYDTLAWRRDIIEDSEDYPSSNPIVLDEIIVSDYQSTVIKAKTAESITIEDKIQQARDRMNDIKPPRRLTSFMSDTERPPPDLVKQTLLKFEASANRRPRGNIQRYGNGDVAAKVATYKSKMSHDSPQSVTKLPPSVFITQHKPTIKPRTTSPKPPAISNCFIKKPASYSSNGHENGNDNENENLSFSKIAAKSIDVERMNQKNAFSTMRFDTKTYRNRTEIPSPQSPIESTSPMEKIDSPGYVHDMVRKRETNSTDFETPIVQLSRKTEKLHLNAIKPRSLLSDVAYGLDETGINSNTISDNDEVDDATSNSSEQGWSESYDVNTSDNDDNDFNHKFHVNKRNNIIESSTKSNGLHSNQTKPTIISVPPVNLISNGSSSPFDRILHESINQPEPSVRQIGIIRPLMTESKPPPVPVARKPLVMAQKKEASLSSDAIKVSISAAPIVVSTQHSVVFPSNSSSLVVTNSVSVATANDIGNDVVVIECSGDSNIHANSKPDNCSLTDGVSPTKANGNCRTNSQYHSDSLPVKTISIDTCSIVHQKNLLNKEKSEEVSNNGGQSNGLTIQSPIKWNIKKSTIVSSSLMPQASSTVTVNQSQPAQAAQTMASKSRTSDIQTTNTMVFNFSDRKDVPDYIENDGLVIRRKRELPKVGAFSLASHQVVDIVYFMMKSFLLNILILLQTCLFTRRKTQYTY